MANLQSTVDLIFNAVDDASATVGKIGDSIESFGDGLETATDPLATLTKYILALDAAIGVAGGALATFALNQAVEAESAMADLSKVTGESADALGPLRSQLEDLAVQYGKNANEATEAAATFVQFGFDVSDSAQLVEETTKLAIAGELGFAEATDIVKSTLLGFRLEATEATRVVDILNEVSNNYATDVRELGIAMGDLSGVADLAGLSLEQTAGVLVPVIEVFGSGSEAANALKTGLLKLVDDAKPVRDALESIGVAQTNANGAMRPAGDILFDVANKFKGLDDETKLYVASQLVGIDQAGKMVQVFDQLDKVTAITATAMGAAGSAAGEVAVKLDTASAKTGQATEAWRQAAETLGERLLPSAKDIIDGMTALGISFGQVAESDALDPLIARITTGFENIATLLQDFARNLPDAFDGIDFSGLLQAIDGLGSGLQELFEAFFGNIDISTVDGLRDALQRVVDSITALTNVTAGIVNGLKPFAEGLGNIVEEAGKLDSDVAESIGSILGLGAAINQISGPVAALGASISAIALAGPGLVSAIKGFGGALGNAFLALGSLNTALGSAGLLGNIGQLAGVTGVGLLTYEVTKFGLEATGLNLKINDLVDELTGLNKTTQEAPVYLSNEAYGFMKLRIEAEQYLDSIKATKETQEDIKNITDKLTESIEAQGKGYDAATGEIIPYNIAADKARDAVQRIAFEFDQAQDSARGWHVEIKDGVTTYTQAGGKIKETNDKIAESSSKAVEKTQEFLLEIAKLKSQENQVAIKVSGDIAVAQIEADAKRVESAFNSVNVGIQSTGDSITGLLSTWAGIKSDYDKYRFEDYINQEFEFRAQQFELQKELIEQQLEYFRDKSRFYNQSLSNGLAIKVQADGLEPYLRAIMHEIFSAITAEAIGSNAEFLLAIAQGQAEAA